MNLLLLRQSVSGSGGPPRNMSTVKGMSMQNREERIRTYHSCASVDIPVEKEGISAEERVDVRALALMTPSCL
jgi:hypothetical protein